MKRLAFVIPVLILAVAASGATARPSPRSARPTPTSIVTVSPAEIRMTFSEGLDPELSGLELKGPHGADVPLGPVAVDPTDPRKIAAPISEKLTPGTYTVDWRATGFDGRSVTGNYIFELK